LNGLIFAERTADWQRFRLKHTIVSIKAGVWGDDPNGDDDLPVIRVADFDRDRLVVERAPTSRSISLSEREGRLLEAGDILIEKSGGGDKQPAGTVVLYSMTEPAVCSNFLAAMKPAPGMLSRYLVYLHSALYSSGAIRTAIKQTTGIQNVDLQDYLDQQVVLPNFEEQKSISAYLDGETGRISQLIVEKQRLIALLLEKRRALITRAITQGLHSGTPLRDSCIPWLGQIPKHWKVERAKWLFAERDIRSDTGDEVLLSVSHLTGVTSRAEKNVNMFMAESLEGYKRCEAGDLVINTLWAWMGAMGVARQSGIVSPAYNVYQPVPELDLDYVDLLVRTPRFAEEVTRYSKGVWSSRLRLYPEGLYEAWLPVPPKEEQQAITAHIQAETMKIDDFAKATERTIALLQERRSALISAAVTGQLEIKGTFT
jgi:type I restriction enzyme S subunit